MAQLPEKANFNAAGVTEGGYKSALAQLRDYLDGLLAASGTAADARSKLGLKDAATKTAAEIQNGVFQPGTQVVFYQASAPTGWTQVTSVNDRALRVVAGAGGGQGGGWAITGLNKGSMYVAGHALTQAQLPDYDLGVQALSVVSGNRWYTTVGGTGASPVGVRSGGSNQAHAHGLGGAPSHDGNWRPAYIDVIVCSKD